MRTTQVAHLHRLLKKIRTTMKVAKKSKPRIYSWLSQVTLPLNDRELSPKLRSNKRALNSVRKWPPSIQYRQSIQALKLILSHAASKSLLTRFNVLTRLPKLPLSRQSNTTRKLRSTLLSCLKATRLFLALSIALPCYKQRRTISKALTTLSPCWRSSW